MESLRKYFVIFVCISSVSSLANAGKSAKEWTDEGLELSNKRMYKQAIVAYTKAIESDPNFCRAYNNRGVAYLNLGREMEQNPFYWSNIYGSNINDDEKREHACISYLQAIVDFNRVTELEPNDPQNYYHRALAHEHLAIKTGQLRDLRTAARLGHTTSQQWLSEHGYAWTKASPQLNPSKTSLQPRIKPNGKTIKLIVTENYGRAKDFKLHINRITKEMLQEVGFVVVESDANNVDATVNIRIEGVPLVTKYSWRGHRESGAKTSANLDDLLRTEHGFGLSQSKFLWSAAEIKGEIILSTQGIVSSKPINGYAEPPQFVNISLTSDIDDMNPYKKPKGAPLFKAFSRSDFFKDLPRMICSLWDVEEERLLVGILRNEDERMRYLAHSALIDIGPSAIPILFGALEDDNPAFKNNIIKILQKLTGEDFGQDSSKWQAWWKQHSDNLSIQESSDN